MNNNSYGYSNMLMPQHIPTVNGREGAEVYRLAPDSNVILLDQSGKLIWIVATDSAGYRNIHGYTITPYTPPEPPDFNMLMNRMSRMEEMLSGLVSANNIAGAKPNADTATISPVANATANSSNGNSANPAAQF